MFRLIYRQRRRLAFGTLFITTGLMLMALNMGAIHILDVYGSWIGTLALVLTALIVAICVYVCAALFIVVFPNWRMMVELLGLCLLGLAVQQILAPQMTALPLIGPFVPFAIMMALFALTYGELLDRFRLWVDYKSTRSFRSPESPEDLWTELVPGEAPLQQHWDPLLYKLEPNPDAENSYIAQYTHGASCYEHQTMTFETREAPHLARYRHTGEVDPKNRSFVDGLYELRIAPHPKGGSKVDIAVRRSLLVHRIALAMWFDDYLGDQTDHLRARHLGKRDWSFTGRYRRKVAQFA